MATELDDLSLRLLGMELCGRYGIQDGKAFLRDQTCTKERIIELARDMPRIRGRRQALNNAPTILEGAASPMEAILALMLSDPPEIGGYGLPKPELNHAIPVRGRAYDLWQTDHITPDLLWDEAKIAIEYDSDAHHTGSQRITTDALRRDVLNELGYRVISVTHQRLSRPHDINRIAAIVGSELGVSIEDRQEDWMRRVGYQTRLRWLATHPRALLGTQLASESFEPDTNWHVRHGHAVTIRNVG